MAFIDECKITFKAGAGGNGMVAWRTEAHVPLGGPAGGDGGKGGSIIIIGDHNENSLQDLKFRKHITAGDGENGQIKNMHGADGADVVIRVPVGTVIFDEKTNEQLVDIKEHEQQYVLCRGGLGGNGNFHFKSGMNKAPTLFELGDLGEIKDCKLVLKHIADVGIIGLPNAGKSTFISRISAAKPKTANYQFTTLIPVLGTIYINNRKIIFADIPGLIEGASEGLGLGHDFLKHIERTSVLIHIISMDEIDAADPYQSYKTIMHELEAYSSVLVQKPMLVVANKMDAPQADIKLVELQKKLKGTKIIPVSAELAENLDTVVDQAHKMLLQTWKKQAASDQVHVVNYESKVKPDDLLDRSLKIHQPYANTWEVECEFLKYWARKIPLSTPDNIIRFNQKMKTAKVEEALKKLGAMHGDTIKIYNIEMQYEE